MDIRFPNTLQQFDEYQSQVAQQAAPGDPRPIYRISQGPGQITFPIRADGSSPFVGTNYSSRNIYWMDPQSASWLCNELEPQACSISWARTIC